MGWYHWLNGISKKPELINVFGLLYAARLFRFDKFNFVCLAVGTSSDRRVIQLCEDYALKSRYYGPENKDGKYCTWYFNSGDVDGDNLNARELFHWLPVKDNPIWHWSVEEFLPIRDALPEMVAAAEKWGYLAFGCDGNKHRGPSVFAMLLCLAGCSPKEATKVANKLYGANFVLPFVRARIAKLGWDLGNSQPELRSRLRILMGLEHASELPKQKAIDVVADAMSAGMRVPLKDDAG